MRSLKVLGMLLCLLTLSSIVMAGPNTMGIREVRHITFVEPVRVGTAMLPAGEYVVRHTMEGQNHAMVFHRIHSKDEFKVKCTLVTLAEKADTTQIIYEVNATNERVLQELVFKGDSAKHVF